VVDPVVANELRSVSLLQYGEEAWPRSYLGGE